MCMSKSPKAPEPQPVPAAPEPPPTEMDQAVKNARLKQRQIAAASTGYTSTIGTSPLGDTSNANLGVQKLGG